MNFPMSWFSNKPNQSPKMFFNLFWYQDLAHKKKLAKDFTSKVPTKSIYSSVLRCKPAQYSLFSMLSWTSWLRPNTHTPLSHQTELNIVPPQTN